MDKNKISRSFQIQTLENLEKAFDRINREDNYVISAKKILEDMKNIINDNTFDDDILDLMSSLVDRIMNALASVYPSNVEAALSQNISR